jgi:hypothetical protein
MKKLVVEKTLLGDKVVGITNGNLVIKECSSSKADEVIKKYHYSHKTTKNRFLSFEVNNGLGYLQLGYGIRPHLKHNISKDINKDNYAEFDRMWLSDELPKNSESQVISLLLSYLKQVYPKIVFLITYADESAGNTGIIYKASNAIILDWVYVDFYKLPNGERVHPVSMYHRHKTRAWATVSRIYPGIKHITDGKQFRFLYILNHTMRKRFQERNAVVPQQKDWGSSSIPLQ